MSGHSHFSTIKRKKEATDKKRGQLFSKISRMISIAVKEKGADSTVNPRLKLAIEKAKDCNMPKENIERAIKKADSGEKSENLEEAIYEGYGPAGVAIIIEVITDNKNRALAEIKQILSAHQGKLVSEGGAKWLFQRKINQQTNNLEWQPNQEIEVSEQEKNTCLKLFEALDENDSVQEIYSNLKI
jgi:YebC/PmpR family DNA-binding regulatory protein